MPSLLRSLCVLALCALCAASPYSARATPSDSGGADDNDDNTSPLLGTLSAAQLCTRSYDLDVGMTASDTHPASVAIWGEDAIAWSTDDGGTWSLHTFPEAMPAIAAATFLADGSLFVVTDPWTLARQLPSGQWLYWKPYLELSDPDAATYDDLSVSALAAVGGRLLLVKRPHIDNDRMDCNGQPSHRLYVSGDDGKSWTSSRIFAGLECALADDPSWDDPLDLLISPDGTVSALANLINRPCEGSDHYLALYSADIPASGKAKARKIDNLYDIKRPPPFDEGICVDRPRLGHGGRAYFPSDCNDLTRNGLLLAQPKAGKFAQVMTDAGPLRHEAMGELRWAANHARTLALLGADIFEIDDAKARLVGSVPSLIQGYLGSKMQTSLDSAGRLWAFHSGLLWRRDSTADLTLLSCPP